MSFPSLVAVLAYCAIVALSLLAAAEARRTSRPWTDLATWLISAAYFASLAAFRLLDGEERFRASLRTFLHQQGGYADRSEIQIVFGVAGVLLLAALSYAAFRTMLPRGSLRSRYAAYMRIIIAISITVYTLRIASWHATDRILYGSPVHFNWIIEIAIILAAAGLALRYRQLSSLASPRV